MKVLFVIGTLNMGGAESQLVRIANELSKRNFEIHVGVLNLENRESALKLNSDVEVHDLGLRFFNQPFRSSLRVLNFIFLLRKNKYKIIYSFMPEAIIVSSPITKIFSRETFRISAVRGSLVRRSGLLKRVYRYFLRDSDLVIFNSKKLSKDFVENQVLNSGKIEVISNGVDIDVVRSNVLEDPPSAITIANFHWYKGYEILIRAIAQVEVECKFIFVGGGALLDQMKALSIELGVAARINFVGNVAPSQYLEISQFAVHPSLTEGLSNAILEEIASGLPVIACNIPENFPLVSDDENGLLVELASVKALAQAITLMASDVALRKRMSDASISRAKNFGWDLCIAKYIHLFTNIA